VPILYEDYLKPPNFKKRAYQNTEIPDAHSFLIALGLVVAAMVVTYVAAKIVWRK
jgi:uncharacterized protein YjeT (DUF2065 family)